MLKEIIDQLDPNETSLQQMSVLMYELGDLAKGVFYAHSYKESAYMIEAKISLSDLLAQCILLCERQGWDFEEVKQMGIERFIERVNRHIQKGE
jgi:hypothetical protein